MRFGWVLGAAVAALVAAPARASIVINSVFDDDAERPGVAGKWSGERRLDDAEMPLTDALAGSLADGELYFNIHSASHPEFEMHGQLEAIGGNPNHDTPKATLIPLPPAVLAGVAGLFAVGWVTLRPGGAGR